VRLVDKAYQLYKQNIDKRHEIIRNLMDEMMELTQDELKLVHGLIGMRLKSLRIGE